MKTTTITTLAASTAEKETMLSERMQDFTTAWLPLGSISLAYNESFMKLVVVESRLRGNFLGNLQTRLLTDRIDTDQRLEDREEGVGFMVHYHRILHLLGLPPLQLGPLRILPLSNKPLKPPWLGNELLRPLHRLLNKLLMLMLFNKPLSDRLIGNKLLRPSLLNKLLGSSPLRLLNNRPLSNQPLSNSP
jgi:hypothetical protein